MRLEWSASAPLTTGVSQSHTGAGDTGGGGEGGGGLGGGGLGGGGVGDGGLGGGGEGGGGEGGGGEGGGGEGAGEGHANARPTGPEVVSIHPVVAVGQGALLTLNRYGVALLSA